MATMNIGNELIVIQGSKSRIRSFGAGSVGVDTLRTADMND